MPTKFPLGQIYFRRGILDELGDSGAVFAALARHASGDWGEVYKEDEGLNEKARNYRSVGAGAFRLRSRKMAGFNLE